MAQVEQYKINKRPKDDIANTDKISVKINDKKVDEIKEENKEDSFSLSNDDDKPAEAITFQEMQGMNDLEEVETMEEERKFQPKPTDLRMMGRKMTVIRGLIETPRDLKLEKTDQKPIESVCLIVVVDAEIRPIMEKYQFQVNDELTEKFLHLGVVSSGDVGNLHLDIIKVAESKVFKRHYSGYTQSAALAALVSSIIKPDIVISFGTAGGVTERSKNEYGMGQNLQSLRDEPRASNVEAKDEEDADRATSKKKTAVKPSKLSPAVASPPVDPATGLKMSYSDIKYTQATTVKIGDVVLGEACLFLDRLRTRNKKAFDWGLWGGSSMPASTLIEECGLIKGVVASQIGYMVNKFQVEMIGNANIVALDMECAPIAQILNQTGIDFLAIKVISNGVYPGNPQLMESEYHDNREMVSRKATQVLTKVINYLDGKNKYALSPRPSSLQDTSRSEFDNI